MRTTVRIPDELLQQAKAQATREGLRLRDLIERGLRLALFEHFMIGRVFSPRLWTDAYWAAFTNTGGLILATFDQGFRTFSGLACEVLEPGQPPH